MSAHDTASANSSHVPREANSMTANRNRARHLPLLLACLLGASMALAATASAKYTHPQGSLRLAQTPAAQAGNKYIGIYALGVDSSAGPSAGDVYAGGGVNEGGGFKPRVFKFERNGRYAGVEFDGGETPQGSFSLAFFSGSGLHRGSIAVDGSTGAHAGDVYIADAEHNVIDRFSEEGKFLCQITGRTPASTEEEEAECAGATGSLTPAGGFGQTSGVAVDPRNGDVYVSDAANGVVDKFNEAGEYIGQLADSHLPLPGNLAFDASGDLYVASNDNTSSGESIVKLGPTGTYLETLGEAYEPNQVAVDPASGSVYLNTVERTRFGITGEIAEYSSTGALQELFGHEATGTYGAIAAGADGYVYTTGREAVPDLFKPKIVVPEVSSGEASEITETTASLHGEVVPDTGHGGGNVTACEFEYIEDAAYQKALEEEAEDPYSGGATAPCEPSVPYSGEKQAVSAQIGSLKRNAVLYHYRLLAADAGGSEVGEDRTFYTAGPPTISGGYSDSLTKSARVYAPINPHGFKTTCEVQYVDQASFEAHGFNEATIVPCAEALPADSVERTVKVEIPDLAFNTSYHYRFLAHNAAEGGTGIAIGEEGTFTTFTIEEFSISALNGNDEPATQAGSHPRLLGVSFRFNITSPETPGEGWVNVPGNIKEVTVELPPGLIGNPTAVPKCTAYELDLNRGCGGPYYVGEIGIHGSQYGGGGPRYTEAGLYNLEAPTGAAGEFGADFSGFSGLRTDFGVRTGSDYGVNSITVAINADLGVTGVETTVYGVIGGKPLLSMPTSCGGPLHAGLKVETWQDPGQFVTAGQEMPAITGCNKLTFEPTLQARPTTNVADAPSGLDFDLHVPQNENPEGLRTPDLKDATFTLPKGITLNPSGANGLQGCTPAQFDLHGSGPAHCPDASKLGTVEVDTPLVDHPLPGNFYVATSHENPFGSLIALYLAIDDPQTGVVIKLPGKVEIDPQSGQLTTIFEENPQLPFEDLKVHLFGGAKAPLRTPPACGSYETASSLTPWSAPESGPPATPSDTYKIEKGPGGGSCLHSEAEEPNTPSFEAGTVTPIAGTYSPFVLHLHREDGTQQISQLTVTPPPGLLAKLAGTTYCPEAALAATAQKSGTEELESPSCPGSSRVGTVNIAAGAGPAPFWTKGTVYLAGPYKGAPLSLAIITPAVAGPFDLGDVLVRAALQINPETGQVTTKSDPIPTSLQGIPLDVRTITVALDRPEFTLNPTSCDPASVQAQELSTLGQLASLSQRFQLANCTSLHFKPQLALSLKGGTHRASHPALTATLTMPPGSAGIARAAVALPSSELLDQGHIGTVCTRVQFAEGALPGEKCPAASIYGHARAITPLLEKPLEGPVYLRSSSNKLPDLVAALNGQVNVVLDGRVDSVHGGIRNTFEMVPDAPVSKFTLEMQGANKGLLENSTDICANPQHAHVVFESHSGVVVESAPTLTARCRAKRHGRRHR
jgi:hypothetical protein